MLYFFSVLQIRYLTFLINVCNETSIQKQLLPTSLNNAVLFSYVDISHFSEHVVPFFSYGDNLLNRSNYYMQ